jgi:hypothetical protein
MYHTINTLHPKNEEKINSYLGFTVLIGLVIAGYVMIGLLVLVNDSMNKINAKMDKVEMYVCNPFDK